MFFCDLRWFTFYFMTVCQTYIKSCELVSNVFAIFKNISLFVIQERAKRYPWLILASLRNDVSRMFFHNMIDPEFKQGKIKYIIVELLVIIFNVSCSTTVDDSNYLESDIAFESCTASMQEQAQASLEMWRCKTREQIVNIQIPDAKYSRMVPSHVRISKCGGTCSSSL